MATLKEGLSLKTKKQESEYTIVGEGIAPLRKFINKERDEAMKEIQATASDEDEVKACNESFRLAPYFSRSKMQVAQDGTEYCPLVCFLTRNLTAKEQEETGNRIKRTILRVSKSIEDRIESFYANEGLIIPQEVENPLVDTFSFPSLGKEFTRLLTVDKQVRRTVSQHNITGEQTSFYQLIDKQLTFDDLDF